MEEIMTFSWAHVSPRTREDKQEDKPTDRKVEQPRRPDKPGLVFPLRVFGSGQRVEKGRRRSLFSSEPLLVTGGQNSADVG